MRNPLLIIDIIIGQEGPLVPEFKQLGNVLVYKSHQKNISQLSYKKWLTHRLDFLFESLFGQKEKPANIKDFLNKNYDCVFSNTITNGKILNQLQLGHCKVITYVHELENAIRRFTTLKDLASTLKHTTHFLVPSNAVAHNLITKYQVNENKISTLNYYIPTVDVPQKRLNEIRKELNIEESLIVCGAGTCDWRKGADIFLQVAIQILKNHPSISVKFLWIGADKTSEDYLHLAHDAKMAGVQEDVIFLDSVVNPLDYMSLMDVFLLTSREDPYPLVVLEASMLRKPTICFEKSGGAVEFVSKAKGGIVSYLNTKEMSELLLELLSQQELREHLGREAYDVFNNLHSEAVTAPVLESFLCP
ncbi:glycosyltransferase [Pontibacter sp. H259]|uniref:glycosyltransferase n=1 Tax=Pontibacter sp. H259 TaxID=3133421 RepID=UPI0030BB8D06